MASRLRSRGLNQDNNSVQSASTCSVTEVTPLSNTSNVNSHNINNRPIMKDKPPSVSKKPTPKPRPSVNGPTVKGQVRSRGGTHVHGETVGTSEGENTKTGYNNKPLTGHPHNTTIQTSPHVVIVERTDCNSPLFTDTNTGGGGSDLYDNAPCFASTSSLQRNNQSYSAEVSDTLKSYGANTSTANVSDSENVTVRSSGVNNKVSVTAGDAAIRSPGSGVSAIHTTPTTDYQQYYVNINLDAVQHKLGIHDPRINSRNNTYTTPAHNVGSTEIHSVVNVSDKGDDQADGASVDSGIAACGKTNEVENIDDEISPYCTTYASGGSQLIIKPNTSRHSTEVGVKPAAVLSTFGKGSPTSIGDRGGAQLGFGKTPSPFTGDRKSGQIFGKSSPVIGENSSGFKGAGKFFDKPKRVHQYEDVNLDHIDGHNRSSLIMEGGARKSDTSQIYATPSPVTLRQKSFDKENTKDAIYASPVIKGKTVAVDKSTVHDESSSSDEEEPIYYNLLLLKRETLKKQQTLRKTVIDDTAIYQSVDLRKKIRDREKRQKLEEEGVKPLNFAGNNKLIPEEQTDEDHLNLTDESRDSVFVSSPGSSQTSPPPAASSTPVLENDSPAWRKRQSMLMAMRQHHESGTSLDSIDICPMDMPVSTTTSNTHDKQQMRKCVVMGILDSEHLYVDCLDVLLQYMRSLQAAAKSSQPVISLEDVDTIFFKIPALYDVHMDFVRNLEPKMERWSADQDVGQLFKVMAVQLPIAGEYIKNYPKAIATIKKCSQECHQFSELTQAIKTKGFAEGLSLEELLHKPLVRVQRNSLVLHDLIKCTPATHCDYDMLHKALKISQYFLENLELPREEGKDKSDSERYLVKYSLIVELCSKRRKLRHVFLYNDLLVCAKQRNTARQKLSFELKWFIPLATVVIDPSTDSVEGKLQNRQEVDSLKKKLKHVADDMRKEKARNKTDDQGKEKNRSFLNKGKNLDKLKKKRAELEGQLVLASPNLKFCLKDSLDRTYTFLMSSDYERNELRDTIAALQAKRPMSPTLSADDVCNQINSCKQLPKMNHLGSFFNRDDLSAGLDDESLSGILSVTIHRLEGLNKCCDIFCCLEVDSYGHFFMKAKTNLVCSTAEPVWNEDFEIDLEGSQTLRIMAYKREYSNDILLGKCALELNRAWLRGDFNEKTITLNEETSLLVSLGYSSREQTLCRMPSNAKTGVFGVPISRLTKKKKVPTATLR